MPWALKTTVPPGGHLVDRLDEGDALPLEAFDHVLVVDDLVVDVQGRADEVDKFLHGVDGHVDAGAEAAGVGEDDPHEGMISRR